MFQLLKGTCGFLLWFTHSWICEFRLPSQSMALLCSSKASSSQKGFELERVSGVQGWRNSSGWAGSPSQGGDRFFPLEEDDGALALCCCCGNILHSSLLSVSLANKLDELRLLFMQRIFLTSWFDAKLIKTSELWLFFHIGSFTLLMGFSSMQTVSLVMWTEYVTCVSVT